jgi:uncharacterized protein YcaQ
VELPRLVAEAARAAWRLAVDEDADAGDPLLTALRARGVATTRELAEALELPVPAVRAGLAAHMRSGAVQRIGHARASRYLA